ncbi:MAG: carbohydrate binding domain-containing protein [Planctomycetota bacterium]
MKAIAIEDISIFNVGLLLVLLALTTGADAFAQRKSIQCFPVSSPRRMDGRLDEWQGETPLALKQPAIRLWTAWDAGNLTIACQAPRPSKGKNGIAWLDLYLDLRPKAERNDVYRRGVYHIRLSPMPPKADEDALREEAKTGTWLAETDDPAAGRMLWKELGWTGVNRTRVFAAMKIEGDHINIEARFPWATFPLTGGKTFEPKADEPSALALDWAVGGAGGGALFWAGSRENPHDPSGLADVELLSSAEKFSQKRFDAESAPSPGSPPGKKSRSEATLRLSERPSGFNVSEAPSPTTYVQGADVRIEVMAGQPTGFRVSPFIFGQFSEHLGTGWPMSRFLYAQALLNPSFEPGHPRYSSPVGQRYLPGRTAELLARWSPTYKTPECAQAAAPPWTVVGDIAGVCLDGDAFNSEQCQRLTARGGEVGLGQMVQLPIHRERRYDVAFYARADSPTTVTASIRDTERILASATVTVDGKAWKKYEARIEMPTGLDPKIIRFLFALTIEKGGPMWIDYATLLPADNIHGLCPEVIEIFRQLKPGHIRYPGGNFASGYHWRDGIGPREKRPTRLNVAWDGLECNEVGTDEILRFCELTGLKVMMCANFGSGSPEEAAEWVEYCNGAPDTPMGKLRAQNGHPQPYNVIDWDIGNEVWGFWQIGHCPPDEYAEGLLRFAKAMRARDGRIRIVACGHSPFHEVGRDWNRTLCQIAGGAIDVMTFHTYIQPLPKRLSSNPEEGFRTVLAHPYYYEQTVRDMADRMRSDGIAKPQIAVTEYNLQWKQFESQRLDRAVHLLWFAQMAHVWMRAGDLVPICHVTEFAPFDIHLRRAGQLGPRYEVFNLYANHAGDRPVRTRVACPTYETKDAGLQYVPLRGAPTVDAVALLGEKDGRRFLTLLAVNKDLKQTIKVNVALRDFAPRPQGEMFVLHDPDAMGKGMPSLSAERKNIPVGGTFAYDLPQCSVSLLRIPAR